MIARFSSTCPACGCRIQKGETIAKAARRYVCADCAGGGGETREPTYKQQYGRCEDAPCCGCCGPHSGGYGDPYVDITTDPYEESYR